MQQKTAQSPAAYLNGRNVRRMQMSTISSQHDDHLLFLTSTRLCLAFEFDWALSEESLKSSNVLIDHLLLSRSLYLLIAEQKSSLNTCAIDRSIVRSY